MWDAVGPRPGSPRAAGRERAPGPRQGEIEFGGSGKKRGKFVKVPSSVSPSMLFDLLLTEWHLPAPNLVVSLVGEERSFAMKSWLRDVLRKGLVKAAQSTGAWVLTSALRVGLARYVAQAVRDHSLASRSTKARVVAIGVASLGRVLHRQLLDDAQVSVRVGARAASKLDLGGGARGPQIHPRQGGSYIEEATNALSKAGHTPPPAAHQLFGKPKALHMPGQLLPWGSTGQEGPPPAAPGTLPAPDPRLVLALCRPEGRRRRRQLAGGGAGTFHSTSPLKISLLAMSTRSQATASLSSSSPEPWPGSHPLNGGEGPSMLHGCRQKRWPLGPRRDRGLKDDGVQLLGALLLEVVHGEQVRVGGDGLQLGHQDKGPEWPWGRGPGARASSGACRGREEAGSFLAGGRLVLGAPTSRVQCMTSSQRRCSPGNFSLSCFSTAWGTRRLGCVTRAASTSAMPPEPARISHGAACSTAQEILCGGVAGRVNPESAQGAILAHVPERPGPRPEARGCPPGPLLPPLPYLQGAGVTIDQQTEDGDLDAAGLTPVAGSLLGDVLLQPQPQLRRPVPLPGAPRLHQDEVGVVVVQGVEGALAAAFVLRGFFTDEDTRLMKKFALYVGDHWNKCDMVAIFLFIVGVTCRVLPSAFEAGRTVLAVDFMVFTLRLIHIFAVHKQLGPKIIIVERMMKDVFFFLFFLSVWLVAYGVTTQALLHPHDGRPEWLFRRVLYRPYLQIFGQIPLDEIDEARVNCSLHPLLQEGSATCPNLYANWLVILLLVTFLLVTNVLLMNLLIAMFSYTFQVVQGNADTFWKFQRYHLIVEYHERPALAPPFILLSHLSLVLKRLFRKGAEQRRARLERDLPEPLDQEMVTWETVQKENYLGKLDRQRKDSKEEVLRKTAHRVDLVAQYLGGLREQEKRIKHLESQVTYCTVLLSSMARGSPHPNSQNTEDGHQQASADCRDGVGSREHPEAGRRLSDT
ncbi:transient receptor potential cation channel subfamily M member 5-like [Suricata suricatta]|uniref:transient receptor potential cation channel subfamily M member 5-like n=1 Tax=Suricata suricatta TaxID=37032 RepID=UPI0011566752|nr:transient receptor potential cation channel subfamily M member 5-like [Suricata suricatta]